MNPPRQGTHDEAEEREEEGKRDGVGGGVSAAGYGDVSQGSGRGGGLGEEHDEVEWLWHRMDEAGRRIFDKVADNRRFAQVP